MLGADRHVQPRPAREVAILADPGGPVLVAELEVTAAYPVAVAILADPGGPVLVAVEPIV